MATVTKEMVILAMILKDEHAWFDDIISGFTFENKEPPCPTRVIEKLFEKLFYGMKDLEDSGSTDMLFSDFNGEDKILSEINNPKKSAIEYMYTALMHFQFFVNTVDEYYYNIIMRDNNPYNCAWSSSSAWSTTPVVQMVNIYKDEFDCLADVHHFANKLVKLGSEIFKECYPDLIDNKNLLERDVVKQIISVYGNIKQELTHLLMFMELIRNNCCKNIIFINNQHDDPTQYSDEED